MFRVGERVRIDHDRWGIVEAVNEDGWPAIHSDGFQAWTGDGPPLKFLFFQNPLYLPSNDIISRLAELTRP